MGGSDYYKCGKIGHYNRDYTTTHTSDLIFFHCNLRGNNKDHYPSLPGGRRAVVASSLATLRTTDDLHAMVDVPVMRT